MRERALQLVDQFIKNQNLKKHLLAVEALMKALAKKFGQPETNWALAGLLHDLDWEITKEIPEKHSLMAAEILEKENFPAEVVQAVKVHNHYHQIEPQTLLDKALYSTEEITGLIVACALVQPSKKLADVTVDSVLRKFKEKSFAAGVNREIILKTEEYLGLTLEELTEIALKAMQSISDELGL
jgi:hypothetical protein